MLSNLVLGVDGGGSKTRALVADCAGRVLGSGTAPSSNYHSVGLEAATQALRQAIAEALAASGQALTPPSPFRAACFGLAGLDRPADHALLGDWVKQHSIARQVALVNDGELLLAAGTPDGVGVALNCGTGSICIGRAADGKTARAGGWGYLIGDEGSGYSLGVQALRLATQTADGRSDAHAILREVLDHWHLDEPEQLLGSVYRPETTLAEIAQLASRVLALAEGGDAHAERIVGRAAIALSRLIDAVVRKLKLKTPPIAMGGSLLRGSAALRTQVHRASRLRLGPATVVEDPAQGAIVLARRLADKSDANAE